MIETREIKMQPKKMLAVLYFQNGVGWTLAAFSGFSIFMILGFAVDYRFFVLSLIWIFLVMPMTVAFLYFVYGMKPLTAFNAIPHKIIFTESDIRVRIIEKDTTSEETMPDSSINISDKDFIVSNKELKEIKWEGDSAILHFNNVGWLWLPSNSMESFTDFKKVLNDLNGK